MGSHRTTEKTSRQPVECPIINGILFLSCVHEKKQTFALRSQILLRICGIFALMSEAADVKADNIRLRKSQRTRQTPHLQPLIQCDFEIDKS